MDRKFSQWFRRPDNVLAFAYLSCLIGFVYRYLGQTLFRTWFFKSDEYVIAAEVIRFSSGDFRQQFFDIPGTLFMMLDAVLWCAAYGMGRLLGVAPGGIGQFTFDRLPALFILMRATTLFFFLLSLVLLFVLTSRVINRAAAAVACLLLAMSETYTYHSSFARTESLALALMLVAILRLLRENPGADISTPPRIHDSALIAGVLAGFAASARLHSLTALLPLLTMILWMRKRSSETGWPRWVIVLAGWTLPAGWLLAAMVLWLAGRQLTELPGAQRFVTIVAGVSIVASGTGLALYLVRRTRPFLVCVVRPDIVKLFIGCCIGGLLANPTILSQYMYFLRSVHMYSNYLDVNRLSWPFWKNLTWYIGHYLAIIAADRLTLALLGLGGLLIVTTRDRKMIPFLAAAVLFFVSKPFILRAQPHHVILWLPFFFMVCAYPAGWMFKLVSSRFRYGQMYGAAGLVLFLAIYLQNLEAHYDMEPIRGTRGPEIAAANAFRTEGRLRNIQSATDWIKRNTEPTAILAISFFCFNPDTFYTWIRGMNVPIPAGALDGRIYQIWWGNASILRGRQGYACATPQDIENIKTKLDLSAPGEGTDPYTDARFQQVMSFGSGANQIDLFRFDYR